MVGEVIAGYKGFRALLDTAKSLLEISDAAKRNTIVVELTDKIRAAQDEQFALVERVNHLEKELTRFENWEREKQRYKHHDFGGSTFAYTLKESEQGGEPPHNLCPNCYDQGHKSILQGSGISHDKRENFDCPKCKTNYLFGQRQPSPDPRIRRRRSIV